MPREFPIGLTPPDWLVRNLRPQAAPPVNRPAVARAAIAMSLPLAVGLATGHPAYGALASMGALSGVIGDTAAAYRMRILNIAIPSSSAPSASPWDHWCTGTAGSPSPPSPAWPSSPG